MSIFNTLKLGFDLLEKGSINCLNYIKKIVNGFILKTIMCFAGSIFLLTWLFLGLSILGVLCEIESWDKTGHWVTLTIYKIFAETGEPLSLFSIPNHLGIQNLLNKILFSSFPMSCFIAFLVLGTATFIMAEYVPDLE